MTINSVRTCQPRTYICIYNVFIAQEGESIRRSTRCPSQGIWGVVNLRFHFRSILTYESELLGVGLGCEDPEGPRPVLDGVTMSERCLYHKILARTRVLSFPLLIRAAGNEFPREKGYRAEQRSLESSVRRSIKKLSRGVDPTLI